MQDNDLPFCEDIYLKHLSKLNGVNFTRREIDIVSCLLNARRTSRIAFILSIAPRTVTTHLRNIMLKLDCNSQEGIINFIEKSQKIFLLREYYASLVIESAFEKSLKEISKLRREELPTCLIVYWQDCNLKNALLHYLGNHLAQTGISAEIQEQESNQNVEKKENLNQVFLLLREKREQENTLQDFSRFDFVDLSEKQNYYFSVFEVLKKVFQEENVTNSIENFKKQYEGMRGVSKRKGDESYEEETKLKEKENKKITLFKNTKFFKDNKWRFVLTILSVSLLGGGFLIIKKNKDSELSINYFPAPSTEAESLVRSDLIIPTESSLLHRPEIINQMDGKFENQDGIQTVALIGPGGAGKTTLARQYATQQKSNTIWEINAETHENLKSSFENLARALSKTAKDQNLMKEIESIKNPTEREEKITQFVKKNLKSRSNWVLIYDNVEKFSDVQKQFPLDSETWGEGKVILTTQDINIQNNKYINNSIQMGELTLEQKLDLFFKIMNQENVTHFTANQIKELKAFLEKIPSFPLDVSVATYYLKATNISYAEYLKKINQHDKDFINVQENILKEAGDYIKTRYGIVTLSLQHIINTHKDFGDLLLFISLLDPQNIPKNLLDTYKKNSIVDNFIYILKKYSLVASDSSHVLPTIQSFSIHRSTQAMVLAYFKKELLIEKKQSLIKSIGMTLEKYIEDAIDEQNLLKMKDLASHCEAFLSHTELLPSESKWAIGGELGGIYFYIANYQKALTLLEKSTIELKKTYNNNIERISRILMYLGITHRELGNYIDAKRSLEESLAIHKNNFSINNSRMARLLAYLGSVHRYLGDFLKAKVLLEESLLIHKKQVSGKPVEIAENLTFLGNVYRDLGNHEKSRELLEESLKIHRRYFPESDAKLPGVLVYLGDAYRELGHYEKARDLLEESLLIHRKHFPQNYDKIAWSLTYLGNVFIGLGNYEKAKNILEEALEIHKKHFAKNYVGAGRTLAYLGNVYRKLGDYEKAKNALENSILVHKKHFPDNHTRVVEALVLLGSVYGDIKNYKKARDLLEESLLIYKKTFPEDHVAIAEAQINLGNVYREMKDYTNAENLLKKGLILYEKTYGKQHIQIAWALRSLGKNYLLQGYMEAAENHFNRALNILQQNNHSDLHFVFEDLADLYLKKLTFKEIQGDAKQSENLKTKAVSYLKQALQIIKTNFHESSPHIIRVQDKLKYTSNPVDL